jgi:coatomer protein complex subunit epsilon
VFQGGDKIQDAYYIYQELIDKFGATPLLLNGQASSFLQQGKVEEAEAALSEALEKDPGDADALVNSVVLAQMTGKPQEVSSTNEHHRRKKKCHYNGEKYVSLLCR